MPRPRRASVPIPLVPKDDRPIAPPWEPLVGEPIPSYQFFIMYRDLPPSERKIDNLMMLLAKKAALGEFKDKLPTVTSLRNDLYYYRWPERCAAWDGFLQRERDVAIIAQARAEGQRLADLSSQLLDAATAVEKEFIRRINAGTLAKQDVKTLTVMHGQAIRATETAARILRLLGREPTEIFESRGRLVVTPGGEFTDFSKMPTSVLRQGLNLLNDLESMRERVGELPEGAAEGEIVEGEPLATPAEPTPEPTV